MAHHFKIIHHLKIMESFATAVVDGRKNFEVRDNLDRGFQRGDEIVFHVVDKHGNNLDHMLNGSVYEITYVFTGIGLQEGYVVFGFRPLNEEWNHEEILSDPRRRETETWKMRREE